MALIALLQVALPSINSRPILPALQPPPACRTHMSPNHGPFPFPKDLFLKFVREHNGYFPVKIQALPEGSCVHVHTPVYQVGQVVCELGRRTTL